MSMNRNNFLTVVVMVFTIVRCQAELNPLLVTAFWLELVETDKSPDALLAAMLSLTSAGFHTQRHLGNLRKSL